jgi:hypothetical protein
VNIMSERGGKNPFKYPCKPAIFDHCATYDKLLLH